MGLGLGNSLSSPVYPQTAYAVTRSVSLDGTNDHIIILTCTQTQVTITK